MTACNDAAEDAVELSPTASSGRAGVPPLDASLFPVVLDRDVLVVAEADGSRIQEMPVPQRPIQASGGVSADGRFNAIFRDGALFIQEGDSAPREIARAASPDVVFIPFWAPSSSRLAYLASTDQLERFDVYVIDVDGSGPTLIGESGRPPGEGADSPRWSPDASWIATYSPGYDGVRVLSSKGAPPIEIPQGSSGHFSWSPDSRFLAFDSDPSRVDPSVAPNSSSIVVAEVAAPGEVHTLTEGRWPRWSPTGDRIAFKRDRHAFTIRADGSGLADLGLIGNEIYNDFTWSEDGQQVEFVRGGPNLPVFTIDLRTGGVSRRDAGYNADWSGSPARDIRISPDGQRIAFPGYQFGQNVAAWLILDVESGDVRQLSDKIFDRDSDVYWTAEGARLVQSTGSSVEVWEAGVAQPLRVATLHALDVAWSPDAELLAIATADEIAIVYADGAERASFDVGGGAPSGLAWSPEGTRLVYEVRTTDDVAAGPAQIFAAEVDSAQITPLSAEAEHAFGATWSPDGQTIAYDRVNGEATEVWLIAGDGANPRRLAEDGGGQLQWSPDGTMIAAVTGLHVNLIDVAAGRVLRIAEAGGASTQLGYCPGLVVRWSQDSQALDIVLACHSPQI